MRRPVNRWRLAAAGTAGLCAMLALSACQVGLGKKDADDAATGAVQQTVTRQKEIKQTKVPAPVASTGIARIDGSARGSLTTLAAVRYDHGGNQAAVYVNNNGAQAAFGELCRGSIDMVDSSRTISADELDLCRQYGLQVVQFQFASDAVVLATKSETDVGADCLTLDQVDNIYRAGSSITNWRDLGFDNVPIRVGGPDRQNNAFDFFGRNVLGAPEPSMTYLRSDYLAFANDAATRQFIIGNDDDQIRAGLASHYAQLVSSKKGVITSDVSNLADARATELAARQNRRKGIIDGRPAKTQAQDQARLNAAVQARKAAENILKRDRNQLAQLEIPANQSARAASTIAGLRGRLAYFRYTYYELFEDDLRPLEISAKAKPQNCIFPSEATITNGQYPLARRLLLTTTTRSLDRREVQDFLLKYLTTARQDAINARLVPIPDSVVATQRSWLLGSQQPRVLTPGDLTGQNQDLEQAR